MTVARWIQRRPLAAYFALAFVISWGGILVMLTVAGFDLSPMQPLEASIILLAMLLGPFVSGLFCTAMVGGRQGLSRLGAHLTHWRVGAHWYAVALLTVPLILLTILGVLSATVDPAFEPRFQWPLFAVGLLAGAFEEIGWTGFATPRLLACKRFAVAGALLGVIWAFWHLLVDFRYNVNSMGAAWVLEFAIVYLATLTPYRMLMTWVYGRTQSLPLSVVMHASFTGWLLVLFPATSLSQSLLWQAVFAVTLWGAVALVRRRSEGRADRPHRRGRP